MPRVDVLGMPVDGLHRPSGKRGTPPMLPRCAKRYILALRIWCWVRGDVQCLGGRGFHNPTPYPCAQALMGASYHHAVPASADGGPAFAYMAVPVNAARAALHHLTEASGLEPESHVHSLVAMLRVGSTHTIP